MNHIHHTEAVVLAGYAKGEADKMLALYTRDFGLVRADAKGIRKSTSKLRFALQPYTIVRVDLIVTRAAYRAGSTDVLFYLSSPSMPILSILYRISALVRRLVPEEEKNEPLYDTLTDLLKFLSTTSQENEVLAAIELLAVFRILYHLGYVTEQAEHTLADIPITRNLLDHVIERRESLVALVNTSLRETML